MLYGISRKGADLEKRIFIFSGYYGSGKTEVATNFAIQQRRTNSRVAIADMDVVNPYFRSREQKPLFDKHDIHLIAPPAEIDVVDLPYLTGEIAAYIDRHESIFILDMGGDDVGTIPLGSIRLKLLKNGEYEVYMVANINRPFTHDAAGIVTMSEMIQRMSGLKPSAIISNTHLKNETNEAMILKGLDISLEASQKLGIPCRYVTIPETIYTDKLADQCAGMFDGSVMKLELFYKTPWEDGYGQLR